MVFVYLIMDIVSSVPKDRVVQSFGNGKFGPEKMVMVDNDGCFYLQFSEYAPVGDCKYP